MIENFEVLKSWILYESKPTTELAVFYFDKFCASPSPELGFSYWAVLGGYEKVGWDAVFGIAPREE